jgi:hypothetical protein
MTGDVFSTGVGVQTAVEGMIVRLRVLKRHHHILGDGTLDRRSLGYKRITV